MQGTLQQLMIWGICIQPHKVHLIVLPLNGCMLHRVIGQMSPSVFAPVRRDFTDEWTSSLTSLKSIFDTPMASNNKFFRVGSHTIDATAFQNLVNYIESNANDELLVCSTREWLEYDEMKVQPINQSLVDDTLTISMEFLDVKNRWKDLSYNITSDSTIESITTTGDSAVFNATTGLVNVFKQTKVW